MSIVVQHSSSFKPYRLNFPINWLTDPYNNKNWLHHFNSLRWLLNEKDLKKVEEVLRSFYNYHCVKKRKNPYYNNKRGDHTAAIRMGVVAKLREKFRAIENISGEGICNRLLSEEVVNLQNPDMYRSGHNHGLMVDIALLTLVVDYPEYKKNINIDILIKRSSDTMDSMWHPFGLTKEHSISYQEYNIPLAMDYFNLLKKLGLESASKIELNKIIEESKRLLGYALKGSGEYFPLGDSFRVPNKKILEMIYGNNSKNHGSSHGLLEPYSIEEGCYSNSHFFIYRRTVKGKKIHFAATCCWDSHNHKQNDELSFCLEVNGITIFDDPGYTEFLPWCDIVKLKSEHYHSTVVVSNKEWSDKQMSNGGSRIENAHFDENGFFIEMVVQRIQGFEIRRVVNLKEGKLYIYDSINAAEPESYSVNRLFVLSEKIDLEVVGKEGLIAKFDSCEVARIAFQSPLEFESVVELDKIKYVMPARTDVGETNRVSHKVSITERHNPVLLCSIVDLL